MTIPVPRGVPKDWTASLMTPGVGAAALQGHNTPSDWGEPTECAAWRDRFGRCRLIVGHYDNGRSATVRVDANGNWKTRFGDVA